MRIATDCELLVEEKSGAGGIRSSTPEFIGRQSDRPPALEKRFRTGGALASQEQFVPLLVSCPIGRSRNLQCFGDIIPFVTTHSRRRTDAKDFDAPP